MKRGSQHSGMAEDKAILSLLGDTDSETVAAGFKLLNRSYLDPREFIAKHQDDEDGVVRRHLHQYGCFLQRRHSRAELVNGIKDGKLPFWRAIVLFSCIMDFRYNPSLLEEEFSAFISEKYPRLDGTGSLSREDFIHVLKGGTLHSNGIQDLFHLDNLMLSEILNSEVAHPLILCGIARKLGEAHGVAVSIIMANGQFLIEMSDKQAYNPASNWEEFKTEPLARHSCSENELVNALLALGHSFSLVEQLPDEAYYLGNILVELSGGRLEDLPYPMGERANDSR